MHLNLLRNVNTILEALGEEMSIQHPSSEDISDDENASGPSSPTNHTRTPLRFSDKHQVLRLRLLPLRSVQEDLQALLGASDWPAPKKGMSSTVAERNPSVSTARTQDFFVWSNAGWKAALRSGRQSHDAAPTRGEKGMMRRKEAERETAGVLASCADDIKALWKDEVVQAMLRRRKMRLDLMPGL